MEDRLSSTAVPPCISMSICEGTLRTRTAAVRPPSSPMVVGSNKGGADGLIRASSCSSSCSGERYALEGNLTGSTAAPMRRILKETRRLELVEALRVDSLLEKVSGGFCRLLATARTISKGRKRLGPGIITRMLV